MLENLVDNTLRHTLDGAWIELGVCSDDQVYLRVVASSTGIGMEDLPFVFDRFYRGVQL